jgi:hypothetical protein
VFAAVVVVLCAVARNLVLNLTKALGVARQRPLPLARRVRARDFPKWLYVAGIGATVELELVRDGRAPAPAGPGGSE